MKTGPWFLTTCRAAIHLPTATAVISDLHFGYAEKRIRQGEAIPLQSLEKSLVPLAMTFHAHNISRLIIAGDLFEAGAKEPILEELRAWLTKEEIELIGIIPGNHDRGMANYSSEWPLHAKITLDDWTVVHGDETLPKGKIIQGHLHPCLRLGRNAAPCYLVTDTHLVLPAYTANASGMNVLRVRNLSHYQCYAIVGDEVLGFGTPGDLRARLA